MSPDNGKATTNKRTVCDHCRRRRIRCDGEFPCNQCNNASLTCKREHVPKRRGPKRGSGRVINELRAQEEEPKIKIRTDRSQHECCSSGPPSIDQWLSDSNSSTTSPTIGRHPGWHPIMSDVSHLTNDEPASIFTTDQFRPTSPSYFHLISTCLDLFMEHIYPIMPLVHMPTLRESINRPLEMFEKNLLYSLCALTSTHMSGKSIQAPGPPCWEAAGRFFLDECISVRHSYDFVEDKSLSAVISSYFVSTAFFEINQSRKSWYYLREALTLGQDLKLHEEASYIGLSPAEALCRRRTFWILYVTERSFAILRHKPLTLSKTPEFPTTIHDYEPPSIHTGFTHLVNSYHLLDSSFVDSWNEAASIPTSTATYTTLQRQLNLPHPANLSLTDIQKADILVTQQWLRLIVWQSSMRQGLLSSTAEDESMTFRYPLKIAHSLLSAISSLPETSIEVHGMGIFEKIFEIGNTMLDVLHACGQTSLPAALEDTPYGVSSDPFSLFIKTLSRTPNSQKQYAALLLQKAAEKPEVLRFSNALGATAGMALNTATVDELAASFAINGARGVGISSTSNASPFLTANGPTLHLATAVPPRPWRGSIVGEVDENGVYTDTEVAPAVTSHPTLTHSNSHTSHHSHSSLHSGDENEDADGHVEWGCDAVWISDPNGDGDDGEGHDGLPALIGGVDVIGSNGSDFKTALRGGGDMDEEEEGSLSEIEIDEVDGDGDLIDVDVDWDFAIKMEA